MIRDFKKREENDYKKESKKQTNKTNKNHMKERKNDYKIRNIKRKRFKKE